MHNSKDCFNGPDKINSIKISYPLQSRMFPFAIQGVFLLLFFFPHSWLCREQTKDKTMWVYSGTVSTVLMCNCSRKPVLPLSVDSSPSFHWPAQALRGSREQSPIPQCWLPAAFPALLLAAALKATEDLSCGRRWQWLMLVPLATEVVWNSHLNTVYGREEEIRDQERYGCPCHQVFLSSGFREVDAALRAVVVCNLVYC